jgi:HTH-type transcriptional regulator/antitoxin HipB
MEAWMIYPIKTLSQFSLVLKGFRKEKGLTQAAIAERLGITQQSYAHFEAKPQKATLDRIFKVLRMLDVEISLSHASVAANKGAVPSAKAAIASASTAKVAGRKTSKTPAAAAVRKTRSSAVGKAGRIATPTKRKESW